VGVWERPTFFNLLEAGMDTGWVVAIVLICICTFAVSSILVKSGLGRSRGHSLTRHEASLKHIR